MNTTNVLRAIDNDIYFIAHYNTKGSHWYKQGDGKRYQSHAKYAMGKPNPDAKERKSSSETTTKADVASGVRSKPMYYSAPEKTIGQRVGEIKTELRNRSDASKAKEDAQHDAATTATLKNYHGGRNKGARALTGSPRYEKSDISFGLGFGLDGSVGYGMYMSSPFVDLDTAVKEFNSYLTRSKGKFGDKYSDAYKDSYKQNYKKYLNKYKEKTLRNWSKENSPRYVKAINEHLAKNKSNSSKYHMGSPNQEVKDNRKAIKEMSQGAKQTSIASKAAINSAKGEVKAAKQELNAVKLSRKADKQEIKISKRDLKDYKADYKDSVKNKSSRDEIRSKRNLVRAAKESLQADKSRYKSDKAGLKAAKTKIDSAKDRLKSAKNVYGSVNKGTKAATIDAIIDSGKANGWSKAARTINKLGYYTRNPEKSSNKIFKAAGKVRNTRVNAYYTAAYSQAYDRLMKAGGA